MSKQETPKMGGKPGIRLRFSLGRAITFFVAYNIAYLIVGLVTGDRGHRSTSTVIWICLCTAIVMGFYDDVERRFRAWRAWSKA